MPSTEEVLAAAVLATGLLAAAYLTALSRQVILALAVLVAALLVAALLIAGDANRETVAAVTMAGTVVYGVFTFQLPIAVVAACVVYLTLWVTDEDGPFDATPPTLLADTLDVDGDGGGEDGHGASDDGSDGDGDDDSDDGGDDDSDDGSDDDGNHGNDGDSDDDRGSDRESAE